MRDMIASQNFLKNDSIHSLERSDLTPNFVMEIGDILFSRINKYYRFFLINLTVKYQKGELKNNNNLKLKLRIKIK